MVWVQFTISSAVIVIAGVRLTKYSDELCERLNWGKVWIGIVLLGLVTSLPEAVTSLVSVISLKAPDLAVGNVLGSNNFNPMLIVLMDMVYRKDAITSLVRARPSHYYSAYFAIALTFLVTFEIFLYRIIPVPKIGYISIGSWLLALIYCAGMYLIARADAADAVPVSDVIGPEQALGQKSLSVVWTNIVISSIVIVLGALWLTRSADTIAEVTHLGRTFVGTVFLAIVTSLPEMVVSLSALKLESMDLALGNIFGSNMMNIFVIFLCAIFYPSGPLLQYVSPTNVITGLSSVLLMVIILVGIRSRNKKTFLGMGWDSIAMLFVFGTAIFLVYTYK